jgi:hypoxanthine phosphoribosyltransferase
MVAPPGPLLLVASSARREPRTTVDQICALLERDHYEADDLDVAYVGFRIPDDFVVGYGLDIGERYRNLPFVCTFADP